MNPPENVRGERARFAGALASGLAVLVIALVAASASAQRRGADRAPDTAAPADHPAPRAEQPTDAQPDREPGPMSRRRPGTGPATRGSEDSEEKAPVVTEHEIALAGGAFKYKVTAGTIALKDDAGKPRANVFYIAYEKPSPKEGEAGADRADRPITFVFNGGPGAAAIWLHLGALGPKRVVLPADGAPPVPPYALADNPQTWLDATDLVFIDPVGTGYSRPEGDPQKAREFYSVRGDIDAVSEFIRIYLGRNMRWLSPKFLAGESYGTTRAAGLSEQLHDRYGIDLDGIVLISTVLNFQTLDFTSGNDTAYPLYLPSYTAIAHYHKRLPPDLQQLEMSKAVAASREWAMGEYASALMKGTSLDDAARDRVAQQLARFSGLDVSYVKRANLRVNPFRFEKELLADQSKVIGRMDGRFSGHNVDPLNDTPDYDPTLSGYIGVFATTFNDYVRRGLKYDSEMAYEFLSPRVGPWDFGLGGRGGYLNVANTLRSALVKMPSLKVLICSGYYDLATPFAAADYTIDQMPLSKELRANVTHHYYDGGHMIYLNDSAMEAMRRDIGAFYQSATTK